MTKNREEVKQKNMAVKQSKFDWDEADDEVYAETHDFDKEAIVEGTMLRTGAVTIKGKEVSLVVLDTSKGERTVWEGAVLESALEVKKALIGDYLGIRYLGLKKGAAGFKYRDFDVRVIHAEKPVE